jgi:hypothetical protein
MSFVFVQRQINQQALQKRPHVVCAVHPRTIFLWHSPVGCLLAAGGGGGGGELELGKGDLLCSCDEYHNTKGKIWCFDIVAEEESTISNRVQGWGFSRNKGENRSQAAQQYD